MISGVDEIRDLDGSDLMGFLLYGDVDLADIELFMADEKSEFCEAYEYRDPPAYGFEITECWVRKVPIRYGENEGCYQYVYADAPGPGARRCVRLEEAHFWGHWCMFHIYEPATTGFNVERVPDVVWPKVRVRIVPAELRAQRAHWHGPLDGEPTVYLCRACADALHAREERARWEIMRDFHAARREHEQAARYEERLRA